MYVSIVLVCIISGASTMASNAKPPSDRCILIKVQVADRDDVATLANMGLDIWEYSEGGLIIRVTDDERNQIREAGFTVETITEDVYEYTEKISKEQISMFAEPTSAKYHSYAEVIDELIALEDSGVAKTYIIGSTHEGRDIWAVKISDNPSEDEQEPGAVFLGCHHAREWISVEVPLYIAQYLIDNYASDTDVKHLIDNCEIWIVPVVNPDGYEYSRNVDRMWRKNRRENGDGTFGVDLNRNYDSMWGTVDAPARTSAETYPGPSPFSELETQAVRDLVLKYDFRILMSYHSFWQAIYYPWAYTWEPPPDGPMFRDMTSSMIELIYHTSGATYTNWLDMPDTYLLSGDTGDWSYGELGIYSFGIELRPVTSSQGGFVLPENQIIPTCEENLPVALYLISYAAADYGIENLTTGRTYNNIQLAVNDANDGDTIVVNPGVYHESVSFIYRNLTLRSKDPNDPNVIAATVINIEDLYQGPVITLSGSINEGCLLDGLTITGGRVGISCQGASPTIRNCLIESNGPNAIEFWEGYEPPTIIDCNITGQVAKAYPPALVAYWKLDETEGSIANDSIKGNDGILHGEPLWQPQSGKKDGALEFDEIDDYISTDFVLNPADGSFSAFAWIKGGAAGQVILSQTGGANWLSADPSEGKLMTELVPLTTRSPLPPLVSETRITDGNWHHIGFIRSGASRMLYVDGVLAAEDTQNNPASSNNGIYIGTGKNLGGGTFFSGLIDDVRIYDQAISAEEITALAE
jgi:hypothetical protein